MLGPHFQFDVVRLARKGYPMLLRAAYLTILLAGLALLFFSQGNVVRPRDFASRAHVYAYVLIVLQNILVLALMPVYLASTIVEEKDNRTLEALSLSHLTDRELVLGKFAARLAHLGAIMLAGFPLLAFMHLWGNVDAGFLLYHEANTMLFLFSGASMCIHASTRANTAFDAIGQSYPWMFLLGFFGMIAAFTLPNVLGPLSGFISRIFSMWAASWADAPVIAAALGFVARTVGYLGWTGCSLVVLAVGHLVLARRHLSRAIAQMKVVRLHAAAPRKPKGPSMFSLTDHSTQKVRAARRRGAQSRIHPAALPIPDTALHWKETLKDGSEYSLTYRWLGYALVVVAVAALPCRIVDLTVGLDQAEPLRNMARALTYTAYFVSLSLYALVIVFQTTLSVAGEREQDTLVFLLLIPESRTAILWHKWLGPLWRNWPLLAVAYLGVLFGLGCGLYSPGTALILFAFPWPWIFLISLVALLLSVLCRRVLIANICLMGFLVLILLAHVAGQRFIGIVFPFYASILFETNLLSLLRDVSWSETMWKALAHQGAFLLVAGVCGLLAFWRFQRKEYASA